MLAIRELFNILATDRGRPISDLTHRLGYSELLEDAESVLARLVPIEREMQDDKGLWYLTRVLPYRSSDDHIGGVVITFVDIDRRKKAEQQVIESKRAAESIIENLHESLLILAFDLSVQSANRAFYEHFKVAPPETIGSKIYDLGSGQWNIPDLRRLLGELLNHNSHFEDFEVTHQFEGIGKRVMLVSARCLDFPQTILLGIRDVTDIRKIEEQHLELAAKDRALAVESTLRETEAELARVLRALSVGELATSIAHEINQPLAGVVTNAEAGMRWLNGDPPSIQDAKESLQLIVRDGNRASAVIHRIREFLKKDDRTFDSLDINEIVEDAAVLMGADTQKRGVRIRRELANKQPRISGDRVQLQQVMVNLISNGLEAMDGVKDRELLIQSKTLPNQRVQVSVRDYGTGVSAEALPRMFEAFFTTKSDGLGMGLSISRTIIEAHGGKIWAELNDGPGITVSFELPADVTSKERA
jgi:two-component system, chemotaxis family, CheB/CheR fusion protein